MKMKRVAFLVARVCVAAFVVVTANYCLLAYIPFTYHQVCLGGLLPWLSAFARIHQYLYWPIFALAVFTLPGLRNDRTRSLTLIFVAVFGLLGISLTRHPALSLLQNDVHSIICCLVALTPLAWMAVLDWRAEWDKVASQQTLYDDTPRLFRACLLAALYVTVLAAADAMLHYRHALDLRLRDRILVVLSSLSAHATMFLAIFLVLTFAGTLSRLISANLAGASLFSAGTLAAALALAARFVVLAPLSFSGPLAAVVAAAVGISVAGFASATAIRLYEPGKQPVESGWSVMLSPARFLWSRSLLIRVGCLAAIWAAGLMALGTAASYDWGYLFRTLIVLAIAAGALAFFYTSPFANSKPRGEWRLVSAAVLVSVYLGSMALQPLAPLRLASDSAILDRFADYEPSFRLARSVLSPPRAAGDESLYAFLGENTNIPRSLRTEPVDVNLVTGLARGLTPKPHIFIFVIDSLRRDYLSPYNSAVTFTPGIAAFARESVVADNAFTRYSGTGLSEPSIWAGAMLLHKQYVTPFHPMNALQQLLDVEGYRQFITKDEILNVILAPSPLITDLDAGRPTMSCEFCQSLGELETRLAAADAAKHPIFAYTQPQDVHISVINRENRSVPPGESYPGFDGAYASRVRRIDGCFAAFIAFLKQADLYDNSVVILTADHGDSLGENGLWGHAYNLVPDVARVPLIIHLPSAMRSLAFDRHAPSFLIDITPTLYYLLGHRPIVHNEIFGRPLFTTRPEEAAPYLRDSYLIASSYAPVYGLLVDNGHALYVVDGVNYKDYFYQWSETGGPGPGKPEHRQEWRSLIRQGVREIGDFYKLGGGEMQSSWSAEMNRTARSDRAR